MSLSGYDHFPSRMHLPPHQRLSLMEAGQNNKQIGVSRAATHRHQMLMDGRRLTNHVRHMEHKEKANRSTRDLAATVANGFLLNAERSARAAVNR